MQLTTMVKDCYARYMQLPKFLQLKPVVEETPHEDAIDPAHIHAWSEAHVTHVAPRRDIVPANFSDPETLQLALFGSTIYMYTCECGETKTRSMLGSTNSQLDDLLDRALEQGPILYHRGQTSFVVQPYVPQQTQGALPLR